MNEIDVQIRWMLLAYPTLYRNRFEAFAELMTNSCYEWSADGRLLNVFAQEDASPESMVTEYEEALEKARKEEADNKEECLNGLRRRHVVEAERDLVEARHVAANVDVYASDYTAVSHRDVWHWLNYKHRHGLSGHWAINNPPANIAEEWRRAIREFLSKVLAPMNSLMGMHSKEAGWEALPHYAEVFDWVMATYKRYESPEDVAHAAWIDKLTAEIVAEIKAEEAARVVAPAGPDLPLAVTHPCEGGAVDAQGNQLDWCDP